ncbi:hypothetical protein R1flu_026031 [Riccia fluitans]|uniref:Uncharacterized protein n=1 Tax=Riccia fluitans TaxID=41844 RepID=A0ABD1XFJ8_9MARC
MGRVRQKLQVLNLDEQKGNSFVLQDGEVKEGKRKRVEKEHEEGLEFFSFMEKILVLKETYIIVGAQRLMQMLNRLLVLQEESWKKS